MWKLEWYKKYCQICRTVTEHMSYSQNWTMDLKLELFWSCQNCVVCKDCFVWRLNPSRDKWVRGREIEWKMFLNSYTACSPSLPPFPASLSSSLLSSLVSSFPLSLLSSFLFSLPPFLHLPLSPFSFLSVIMQPAQALPEP